ncbi:MULTISPECIES: flagellar hook-basal body complex protein FliE [Pseudomonas]|mgnify:CR=1 FL=1|jgi:flagellar hook-basal body complex protein FliE|uniref:Flagellar hook-basal body complex protein FliE n=2 Tax=Pseudomonas TaxID=286 RepID=A0A9Q5B4Z7_PSEFR|nr:flagellar hook-basal body complex protein FliE [Pseudomonas fragi]ARQ74634.1 flagellar hook-basal body protein FliE [Pseudomonas fragi]MBM1198458.1 flagellar hook-basal body complex protein FliE [Pseudomonas fragi]MBM1207238.1 flagellar hook-basal body complex protein FliE [Pseudomonas fragi]NNA84009.1 flagellar hook-basal body complex protein FliE [Pseudomonas fragi]NNB01472.1 flagellar hook-basal body complex protein FliE [Pseudomonas fragi]
MSSILSVQQNLLGQMEQAKSLAQGPMIQPAAVFDQSVGGGIGAAFEQAMRAVDTQQHVASKAMADVDSGKSDNLAGAMIESQKASVAFSALLQVRNKLTTAFDDVMRMPL